MKHWMFNCKCVSEKISDTLDRPPPVHHRMLIRLHMLMCGCCSNLSRQLSIMSQVSREEDSDRRNTPALSREARKRICNELKKSLEMDQRKIDTDDQAG